MNQMQEYRSKLVSAAQAVQIVQSGDWVDYSFCHGQPYLLDRALAERRETLTDVKIRGGLCLSPLAVVESDPEQAHFTYVSWHLGGYERKLSDRGLCHYMPMVYRAMPLFYRKSLQVDVAMICVTPMDKNGFFHFSLNNSASRAILDCARHIILEVNEHLPFVGGVENSVHISEVDAVVEGEHPPLPVLGNSPSSETDQQIARLIIGELCDGATIQLGVGALPNAIGEMLANSDLRNLGVHTEMLVDAYLTMAEAGKITNIMKKTDIGKTMFTFCAGSQRLYDWVRDNGTVYSGPVDYVNEPTVMAKNDCFMSINSCIEVDLSGQCNSESSGMRQISGTGGQLDFLTGAYLSRGGKSFLCCHSTFTDKKTGQVKSRILPALSAGSVVTSPRSQSHCLVTEWGIADLAGRSLWERAERLVAIAHPDFRDELIQSAASHGVWRRTNRIA